jgi:hypothetical protein
MSNNEGIWSSTEPETTVEAIKIYINGTLKATVNNTEVKEEGLISYVSAFSRTAGIGKFKLKIDGVKIQNTAAAEAIDIAQIRTIEIDAYDVAR